MALVQMVEAQDVEERDLIDLAEIVDTGDLIRELMPQEFAMVTEPPVDVDTWHVEIRTNVGNVIVTRDTKIPYGGVRSEDETN